jgi:hypothetical protein
MGPPRNTLTTTTYNVMPDSTQGNFDGGSSKHCHRRHVKLLIPYIFRVRWLTARIDNSMIAAKCYPRLYVS